jgi:hypothetical protein
VIALSADPVVEALGSVRDVEREAAPRCSA